MTMNAHNASISLLPGLLLSLSLAACGGGQGGTTSSSAQQAPAPPKLEEPQFLATSPNGSGVAATYSKAGFIDQSNPFFKPFGNGRSCASCHQATDGWSLTPTNTLARFDRSGGSEDRKSVV